MLEDAGIAGCYDGPCLGPYDYTTYTSVCSRALTVDSFFNEYND